MCGLLVGNDLLSAGCNLAHLYGRSPQQAALRAIAILAGQPPSIPSHMWLSCSLHPFLLSRMLPTALSLCTCCSCFPHPSLSSIPAASPGRAPARGWRGGEAAEEGLRFREGLPSPLHAPHPLPVLAPGGATARPRRCSPQEAPPPTLSPVLAQEMPLG